ncbi:MAG TPA: tetratricopeptide repeat protein [Acidimicrobiales bacterium]|nr:tetratricopeptide repeat protein [Acidimicrobiales bacterium]
MTGSPRRRTMAATLVLALCAGGALGRFVFLGNEPPPAVALADPSSPSAMTQLGLKYLGEARRTADPTYYAKSSALIARSLAEAPDDVTTIVASGLLALSRHDFGGALAIADEARRVAPLAVDPLAVRIDALVELGRYDEAASAVDDMVSRKPNVASLSRASYVAELRGDRDGALDLMQSAVAAARPGSADLAYVLALLGDLELGRGRLDAAASAYARSVAAQRHQPQAELGLARVLVARGDLAAASSALSSLTARIPLPDAVALHGDVLSALGDDAGALEQYDLVRAIESLSATAGGVAVDLELARFEATQIGRVGGDADRAIPLARAARESRPTIFADDILAWTLRKAGRSSEALPLARAAVRTDTGDAALWWHLAAIESDLGRFADARTHLAHASALGGPLPLLERVEASALATTLAS